MSLPGTRPGTANTWEDAVIFLEEAAKYFENRDTKGEDRAYWANVYNAENCREIVKFIKELQCQSSNPVRTAADTSQETNASR